MEQPRCLPPGAGAGYTAGRFPADHHGDQRLGILQQVAVRVADHFPVAQHGAAVAEGGYLIEVVGNIQNGNATVAQAQDGGGDQIGLRASRGRWARRTPPAAPRRRSARGRFAPACARPAQIRTRRSGSIASCQFCWKNCAVAALIRRRSSAPSGCDTPDPETPIPRR